MAGMQTLSGSYQTSFFLQHESAHKSLSGDMGEHAFTWLIYELVEEPGNPPVANLY